MEQWSLVEHVSDSTELTHVPPYYSKPSSAQSKASGPLDISARAALLTSHFTTLQYRRLDCFHPVVWLRLRVLISAVHRAAGSRRCAASLLAVVADQSGTWSQIIPVMFWKSTCVGHRKWWRMLDDQPDENYDDSYIIRVSQICRIYGRISLFSY